MRTLDTALCTFAAFTYVGYGFSTRSAALVYVYGFGLQVLIDRATLSRWSYITVHYAI